MKILYLSTSDISGGAARGAYRLHKGLINKGVDSTLLVQEKVTDDLTVHGPRNNIHKAIAKARPYIMKPFLKLQKTTNTVEHSVNLLPSGLVRRINSMEVDIVQMHFVGGEMISICEIEKIKKPIVWRLADMWAFCGAEHYTSNEGDLRYQEGYKSENRIYGHKGIDIDRWVWNRKMKYWYEKHMTIVTGSKWLRDCAKSSVLFKNKRIEVIPSGLDINVYKPIEKNQARNILNLPLEKKIVLYGAINATSDKRKGFHLLQPALIQMSQTEFSKNLELVVFGASSPKNPLNMGMKTHYTGRMYDDYSLALLYSAADVMVVPSLQEAFGQTASEAFACGCPVVSFGSTGLLDIVDHCKNGYLARPFDSGDLARGIQWVFEDENRRKMLSVHARKKAEQEYAVEVQVERYLKLYKEVIGALT